MKVRQIKQKVIIIVGPTASGKSDLAVSLAKKFDGEVVSADSRQVYRGMDLGTGKITKKEMDGVRHHLLDVADPKKVYTVSDYQKDAQAAVADILSRGKLPIVCGGTGLYIQSIVDDISIPEVPPNAKLRRALDKKTAAELFITLKKMDPVRAKNVDAHNPRRLVRAIEIADLLGRTPPLKKRERYQALEIGIDIETSKLAEKIALRLAKRLKMGMAAEVKRLRLTGVSWKRLETLGLEYRYLGRYLHGLISKEEMITELVKEISRYARRQMTWFRKDGRIVWIKKPLEAEQLVKNFLLGGQASE